MTITAVLGFLSVALFLAAIGGLALAAVNAQRGTKTRPGITLFVLGIVGGILLSALNSGLVLVQPNERAIVFNQVGGTTASSLSDEPLQPGLKWIIPFVQTSVIYDVGRQEVTMSGGFGETSQETTLSGVRGRSNDGQEVLVDVTVIYTIDPTKVNQVHINWRSTYLNGYIVPQARSAVRDNVAAFSAEQIYSGGRTELQSLTFNELEPRFSSEGFVLIDLLIRDVTFSEQFAHAIEEKQIAEQEAQRAVFLVQQQEQEAERARVEAQGLADAEVIRAQGEAQAIIARAEAESEALRLVNLQLSQNPNLIQYTYIQTLADNVQLVLIPSNSPFLFDIQELLGQNTLPAPVAPGGDGQ